MPLAVRAKGVSLSTATNWAFNFLVGWMTPLLQEIIEWRLYPMHGFFCVCSFILGKCFNQKGLYMDSDECLRQYTSVRLRYTFRDVSPAHALVVYPETKGVPLEEMDAVFGEGES